MEPTSTENGGEVSENIVKSDEIVNESANPDVKTIDTADSNENESSKLEEQVVKEAETSTTTAEPVIELQQQQQQHETTVEVECNEKVQLNADVRMMNSDICCRVTNTLDLRLICYFYVFG